jgi:hypothetical protein
VGHTESWGYVLHCLNKALVEAQLQYVFGETTSTLLTHVNDASHLVEKETVLTFKHKKSKKSYLKALTDV